MSVNGIVDVRVGENKINDDKSKVDGSHACVNSGNAQHACTVLNRASIRRKAKRIKCVAYKCVV